MSHDTQTRAIAAAVAAAAGEVSVLLVKEKDNTTIQSLDNLAIWFAKVDGRFLSPT